MRCHQIACVTLGVLFLAAVASAQAPSGEAVYKQHCAACHEDSIPRMPTREALRGLTPEHVETALSSFSMRRQAAALSPAERRAVAAFVTGRPAGSYRAPLEVIPKTAYCSAAISGNAAALTGPSWNGWGINAENTRFQSAQAAGITMTECRLLEEHGRRHFMTKRFDRHADGSKLHMQSLGGLAHFDYNEAGAYGYEQAFLTIRQLGLPMAAIEEQFRRMLFNVVARNQDDHVKNIAFLMDKTGAWRLAPAFDVT